MVCKIFPAFFVISASLGAQSPSLRLGEGLAVASPSGEVNTWGDVDALSPMGSLSKLLWLRLEAGEWEGLGLEQRCRGELDGVRCTSPKGHGRVDPAKAFKEDCNVAFYVWANQSLERWKKDFGEGGARLRLNEVFGPFIGERLPAEPALPAQFGAEWFAEGQLLQASPLQLAKWLANPSQERLLRSSRAYMLGFTDFIFGNDSRWWIRAFEAQPLQSADAPAQPGGHMRLGHTWVLGGNGLTTAILRLPAGIGSKGAQARLKALLNIK